MLFQFFFDQAQPVRGGCLHQMIVVAVGGGGQHRGGTVLKRLQKFPHVLPGTDVHLGGDTAIDPVADADILDPAAVTLLLADSVTIFI